MNAVQKDMQLKDFNNYIQQNFGMDVKQSKINVNKLPENNDELQLHMQLSYKQNIEIAEEQAINVLMKGNQYEQISKRFYYDLAVLGIGAVKTSFNTSEGVVID